MNIAVVGLSHKTAPVDVREKLSIPDDVKEKATSQLRSYPHLEEVAILSTCNRMEVYVVAQETDDGIRELTQFLSEWSQIPLLELRQHLFILLHQDAVMHLMRVSAGLDSLVLGEGQILAQVKQTHKLSQNTAALAPFSIAYLSRPSLRVSEFERRPVLVQVQYRSVQQPSNLPR